MYEKTLSKRELSAYKRRLFQEERAPAAIEKYLRDVSAFAAWLGGRPVTKELTVA